jgi:hypothetical protein
LIDYNDYIRYQQPNGTVVIHYHAYCDKCGEDRGYQRKERANNLCRSCGSSGWTRTEELREKVRRGVKKYYDELHEHREIQTESPKSKRVYQRKNESKWKAIRRDAKRRDKKYPEGFRYDFTDEEIQKFLQQPCFYCEDTEGIGLDRINNDIGHCKRNCLPCCTLCNLTRGDRFTVEEFKLIGKVIKQIKINRKMQLQ